MNIWCTKCGLSVKNVKELLDHAATRHRNEQLWKEYVPAGQLRHRIPVTLPVDTPA